MSPTQIGLRAISWLVPAWRREEWLEEWQGELEALRELRAAGNADGYPGELSFVVGAFPHALWARREDWRMSGLVQDLRYAVRVLGRAPGFTVVAALTLALGIGANASMFTLVNGLLFRSPPGVDEPERLVQIARSYTNAPRWDTWSYPALQEIGRATEKQVFDGVAGYASRQVVVGLGADAESVIGQYVTGNFFGTVGVHAALGRLLEPSDDVEPGANPVIVLSHDLWSRRFGGDRGIVGRTLEIAGSAWEIVGVTSPDYVGLNAVSQSPALYLPLSMIPPRRGMSMLDLWGSSWITGVGRLAEGVSFEAARASMAIVGTRLRAADPVNEDIEVLLAQGVGLDPSGREQAATVALLLLGIAALVLLLTCANVANLFLARATARTQEMGVRVALGAGRARIARQLLTESLVLSLIAVVIAYPIVRAASDVLPLLFNNLAWSIAPDARVVAALLGLGVLAGLLFGALPAIAAGKGGVAHALGTLRTTAGPSRTRVRDGLVVLQLAISLALMTASTLLGRSVANAASANPGFDSRGLVVAFVNPELTGRYDRDRALRLFDQVVADVRALPGVAAATFASTAPFVGAQARTTRVPADRADDPAARFQAGAVDVGPDYFETMGIPLLRGRTLLGSQQEPEPVVVINQAAADFFWPGQEAVGKSFAGDPEIRVVGVVGNAQNRSLRGAAVPIVYEPLGAMPYDMAAVIHVRTTRPYAEVARALRESVARIDPGLPVSAVADVHSALAASIGETRTFRWLVSLFAGLAFVLSIIGLYGLVSYTVSRRVREIGIRMALGAEPTALVGMVVRRVVALAMVGIGVGLALAWSVSRALQGLMFGVSAANLIAPAAASLLLLTAAVLAAWLPARRAGRVNAVTSLRE